MFFCLGKKERTCDVPSADLAHPPMASRAAKLRKTRRFMIYVHSKLMVSTEFVKSLITRLCDTVLYWT